MEEASSSAAIFREQFAPAPWRAFPSDVGSAYLGIVHARAILTNELLEWAARGAGVLIIVIQVALIPLVLMRRKEASSTIAWILTLVFLPLVGAFLFLLFG